MSGDEVTAHAVSTGLVWGFRGSFLGYIRRILDGRIAAGDGVGLTTGYEFHFPLDDASRFDPISFTGEIRFAGRIQLSGHAGAIALDLAAPWLRLDERAGSLSLIQTSRDGTRHREALFDVPTVTIPDRGDGLLLWDGLQPVLTEPGALLFEGNYAVGAAFDPLDVRIPLPGFDE